MSGPAWIGDDADNLHRIRPSSAKFDIPRAHRRADLVCSAAGTTPMLLAVVFPREAPAARLHVDTQDGGADLGGDFTVFCRCGGLHHIDGARLRAEVLANPVLRGRVPQIDVRRVTADTGN